MRVITAPEKFVRTNPGISSVFLAGGISNCPDWQSDLISHVKFGFSDKEHLFLFNPRRPEFDLSKRGEAARQMTWEHEHLEHAGTILFWFPKETLCPITLFELGNYLEKNKHIIIGCDPHYKRKEDVAYQTYLRNPKIAVYQSWEAFMGGVAEHFRTL